MRFWAGALAILWLVAACSTGTSQSLPSISPPLPSATATKASPTVTPLPTASPSPTATPLPRETASPPTPTPGAERPSIVGAELFQLTKAGGLQAALDAGVHWVRYGAFDWDRIEPERTEPPTYHWEVVDEAGLARAADLGLEVIAVVRFAPEWAQGIPGHACGPIDEEAYGAWVEFLTALVARYSAPPYSIRYWELGNEPDIDPTLVGKRNIYGCWGNAEDEYYGGGTYAEMLKHAYPAIKDADPNAHVLIGGLLLDCDPRDPEACQWGSHKDLPPRFLEGILVHGGGPYFDIVSFHAYARYAPEQPQKMTNFTWPGSVTVVPEKAQFIREVLSKYGFGNKPLMNTETALQCTTASVDCYEGQAMYAPKAYGDAMSLGLQAQVYYAITTNWYNTGLLNQDLTPKPVYNAYKTASNYLAGATYRGAAAGYPAGIAGHAFGFLETTNRIDVIWSQDGTQKAVALPAGSSAYNRYGTLIAGDAILVTYEPVYVLRP